MRLHDRFILRALLTPLVLCLGGFMVFWVTFFFFTQQEKMREAKLGAGDMLEYCVATLPEFFILVMPTLLLLALLYALTHHARHNEITALRAAGLSIWRICLPYFALGLFATGLCFALNEAVVPVCRQWSSDIMSRHLKKTVDARVKTKFTKVGYHNTEAHRTWLIGAFDSVTATIYQVDVSWMSADGVTRQLRAEQAVYTNKVWVFSNVQQFILANGRLSPLVRTNELAMPEFEETPRQFELEAKFSDASGLLSSRSADIPLKDLWPYLQMHRQWSAGDAAKPWTKFHARLSEPWKCFIVVLMAIPFGAQSGRRNLFFGVAGSIFICFSFIVLQMVFLAVGMSGHLTPWLAAWLPNILFTLTGIILTLRVR